MNGLIVNPITSLIPSTTCLPAFHRKALNAVITKGNGVILEFPHHRRLDTIETLEKIFRLEEEIQKGLGN
jgi:hypothetical protein